MRTIQTWGIFAVMGLFVFLVAGCGGGSLDPETDDPDPTSPFAYVDSYDIPAVLNGKWLLTEGSGSAVSTSAGTDDTLSLTMAANTQMNFSDVNISGDTGTAFVYYSIRLRAFDDSSIYRGDFEINSYRSDDDSVKIQAVNLTHYGKDVWRAENADGDIMLLSLSSANVMLMDWDGFKYLTSGDQRAMYYHCTLDCSFTKQ